MRLEMSTYRIHWHLEQGISADSVNVTCEALRSEGVK